MRNVDGSTDVRPLADDVTRWVSDPDDHCFTMFLDASGSIPALGSMAEASQKLLLS